jgi:hypothetical protein
LCYLKLAGHESELLFADAAPVTVRPVFDLAGHLPNEGCSGIALASRKVRFGLQSVNGNIERHRMLVKCTECGSDVSDRAPSCPRCGSPSDAFAKEPSPGLGRDFSDPVNDGTRPFDPPKFVSKLQWHQTPGYQSLDKTTQDITTTSYANALLTGTLTGFVISVIISIIANKLLGFQNHEDIIIYIIPICALVYVVLKYYFIQKVVKINESKGVDFFKPTDSSWRYAAIIIIGALVLHNTRPTDQALLNVIDQELEQGIANGSISQKDGIGETLVKLGCKMYSKECAKVVRSMLDISVSDLVIIRVATIKLDKDEAYCFGALNRWFCQL